MAQKIATTDGGNDNEHAAANLETIVVDPDDVIKMFERNDRDQTEQRSHCLRVTPPLEGEREASLYVSDDHSYYPPEMSPKPIHIGANLLFSGRADAQLDPALLYPDLLQEESMFRSEFDAYAEDGDIRPLTDDEEEAWAKWWSTAVETWERTVRMAMSEPVEIELGGLYAEEPTTTITVRFESDE